MKERGTNDGRVTPGSKGIAASQDTAKVGESASPSTDDLNTKKKSSEELVNFDGASCGNSEEDKPTSSYLQTTHEDDGQMEGSNTNYIAVGVQLPLSRSSTQPSSEAEVSLSLPGAYAIAPLRSVSDDWEIHQNNDHQGQALQMEEQLQNSETLDDSELVHAKPICIQVATPEHNAPTIKTESNATKIGQPFKRTPYITLIVIATVAAAASALLAHVFGFDGLSPVDPEARQHKHQLEILHQAFGKEYFDDPIAQKALHWILHEDPQQTIATKKDIDQSDDADHYLIERYSLVAFYLRTNRSASNQWKYCNPPTGKQSDICFFRVGYHGAEFRASRWLSSTSHCVWMGVTCNKHLNSVTELLLWTNNITGSIPPELSMLSDLQVLDLRRNSLSGSLPTWITEHSAIEQVALSTNKLTGTIPLSYFSMESVAKLELEQNQLTGRIPTEIGLFGGKRLELDGNHLTGSIPEEMSTLTQLTHLSLGNAGLTGTLPNWIGELSKLTYLSFGGSESLGGTMPSEIGLLQQLYEINFEGTKIAGAIPNELYQLPQLAELYLSNSRISGIISSKIGLLTDLRYIRIQNTRISGTLPEEISLISTLKELDVHGTENLTGSIPMKFCANRRGNAKIIADCLPSEGSDGPKIFCLSGCCTVCCDTNTGICLEQ